MKPPSLTPTSAVFSGTRGLGGGKWKSGRAETETGRQGSRRTGQSQEQCWLHLACSPLAPGRVLWPPMPTAGTVRSCPVPTAFPTWAYIIFLTALVGMRCAFPSAKMSPSEPRNIPGRCVSWALFSRSRYLWAMPVQWLLMRKNHGHWAGPNFWPSVGTFIKRAFQVQRDR